LIAVANETPPMIFPISAGSVYPNIACVQGTAPVAAGMNTSIERAAT
jgi:hypothetical protein